MIEMAAVVVGMVVGGMASSIISFDHLGFAQGHGFHARNLGPQLLSLLSPEW